MMQIVPIDSVEYLDDIPLDTPEGTHCPYLYSPDDPNLCDDDHILVMDYEGFIKWFPEWNRIYADQIAETFGDDWYKDNEGAKYLRAHINRTVSIVKMKEVLK